jgi:hypothetical protein
VPELYAQTSVMVMAHLPRREIHTTDKTSIPKLDTEDVLLTTTAS